MVKDSSVRRLLERGKITLGISEALWTKHSMFSRNVRDVGFRGRRDSIPGLH